MKAILYSVHPYERIAFDRANSAHIHELTYLAAPLDPTTARLAEGYAAVIPSLNDIVDATLLQLLANHGVRRSMCTNAKRACSIRISPSKV
jgi:D-lactate dehydrogenase